MTCKFTNVFTKNLLNRLLNTFESLFGGDSSDNPKHYNIFKKPMKFFLMNFHTNYHTLNNLLIHSYITLYLCFFV